MKTNVKKELVACIKYFLNTFSTQNISYGLVFDSYPPIKNYEMASIAGTGYLFSALVLASIYNIISKEDALRITKKALETLEKIETREGFYYHFYDMETGKPRNGCEVSDIDTSILLLNLLVSSGYFGLEVSEIVNRIYARMNFKYFVKNKIFYMAINNKNEIIGKWDHYAEQLMLYVLAAASPTSEYAVNEEPYYSFKRPHGKYGNHEYIYSWSGSIFAYQYSQQFINFKNYYDKEGDCWYKNSLEATLGDYQYCIDNPKRFKTFSSKSWGLTACLNRNGYFAGYGGGIKGEKEDLNDGTVSPCGALGSMNFTPKESLQALNNYYSYSEFIGKYGLYDSYNLDDNNFFAKNYIAIDKGITMIALANYHRGTVYRLVNKTGYIKKAFKILNIKKRSKLWQVFH